MNVANVEVLPVPMLPVANAGQGRRDGAGFYHGPGEMTRKIALGAIYLRARGGVAPATRGALVLALPIAEKRFPNVAFRKMMQFFCFINRKMMQISLDRTSEMMHFYRRSDAKG